MKFQFALLPLLLTASLAACGGSPSSDGGNDSSSAASTTTQWEAAIRCDGATLDVNTNERRNVQFVIRDQDAIQGIQGTVDLGALPAGTLNAKGELIFQGSITRGVFHANDFSSGLLKTQTGVTGYVTTAEDYPNGLAGGGDPSDLEIWFGEYTNWRFRSCRGQF